MSDNATVMRRLLVLLPIVAIVATGCADESLPASNGSPTAAPSFAATPLTPSVSPAPATGSVPPEVVDSPEVQAAVADLAERLGVATEGVAVVQVSEVTWPNSSLGCPRAGMQYTQALVNGQLVVLAVDGRTYEYHSGPGRPLFYCVSPTAPAQGGGQGASP